MEQYHDLFLDLGKLLLRRELWSKALDCLAVIQECAQVSYISLCRLEIELTPSSKTRRRLFTTSRYAIKKWAARSKLSKLSNGVRLLKRAISCL